MTKYRLAWHLYSSEINLSCSSFWPFSSITVSDSGILVSCNGVRFMIAKEDIDAIDWRRCLFVEVRVKFAKQGRYDRLRLHCFRVDRLLRSIVASGLGSNLKYDPQLPFLWSHTD